MGWDADGALLAHSTTRRLEAGTMNTSFGRTTFVPERTEVVFIVLAYEMRRNFRYLRSHFDTL